MRSFQSLVILARIFHELLAATTDLAVLPGVLRCRLLRRTVQVRLGTNTLRLPGGTSISTVSRQQFMKYPGWPVSPQAQRSFLQVPQSLESGAVVRNEPVEQPLDHEAFLSVPEFPLVIVLSSL